MKNSEPHLVPHKDSKQFFTQKIHRCFKLYHVDRSKLWVLCKNFKGAVKFPQADFCIMPQPLTAWREMDHRAFIHKILSIWEILKWLQYFIKLFTCLRKGIYFLVALDLCRCARAFSSCSEWGLLSSYGAKVSHCGGFSCCGPWALEHKGSVDMAWGLSCPTAVGILLDQGSNWCPLHWQTDSQPLDQQGSPKCSPFFFSVLASM